MAIALRKPNEIEKLRAANKIVGGALELLQANTKVGISLKELDAMAEDYVRSHAAKPSFKGLYGFPNAVCTSLNNVIIHGIPTDYKLQEGDVIGYDIGTELDEYFGDARQSGSSHRIYKTPWLGDPRVNIQNKKGKAKPYQVKQVLKAIDKLGEAT